MIQFSKEICGDLDQALRREWLETNGLGGFASSSIIGLNTRRYHGLLVAATKPPVGRLVLLSKLEETLILDGERFDLSANQYAGAIHPQGYVYLESFRSKPFPQFTYGVAGIQIQKSVFLVRGQNSVVIRYQFSGNIEGRKCSLDVRPLIAFRDYHSTTHTNNALNPHVEERAGMATVKPYADLPSLHFSHNAAALDSSGFWFYNFDYERERERGLDYQEDLYSPFLMHFDVGTSTCFSIIASLEEHSADEAAKLEARETDGRKRIVAAAPASDEFARLLTTAADQFIVSRGEQRSVIAGYPWFGDWGRDTMISLPGLTLVTGRYDDARSILREFAANIDRGMLPNRFPDAGEAPEYNTVDATLWMFHAVFEFLRYTRDYEFVRRELYEPLTEILSWHERGTRYGIGLDSDGLLHAGAPGVQLTWMDAKVGDWVVTPRRGKPVEVNALWYCALRCMESWAMQLAYDALEYGQLLTQVRENFARRFWYEEGGYLYDVVDVDGIAGQNDAALRPNQLFAASLTTHLLSEEQTRSMLQKVTDQLLTPMGLRTLSPRDPDYHKHFNGKREERDAAYHQGAIWPWLIGPYVDVHLRLNNDCLSLLPLLQPLVRHLWDDCVGSICEVAEPESFAPAGCFAQAWSVAELLRVWLAVAG